MKKQLGGKKFHKTVSLNFKVNLTNMIIVQMATVVTQLSLYRYALFDAAASVHCAMKLVLQIFRSTLVNRGSFQASLVYSRWILGCLC